MGFRGSGLQCDGHGLAVVCAGCEEDAFGHQQHLDLMARRGQGRSQFRVIRSLTSSWLKSGRRRRHRKPSPESSSTLNPNP